MENDRFIQLARERLSDPSLHLVRNQRTKVLEVWAKDKKGTPYNIYDVMHFASSGPGLMGTPREPVETDIDRMQRSMLHHRYEEFRDGRPASKRALDEKAAALVKRVYQDADDRRDQSHEDTRKEAFQLVTAPKVKWLMDNWHSHGQYHALPKGVQRRWAKNNATVRRRLL